MRGGRGPVVCGKSWGVSWATEGELLQRRAEAGDVDAQMMLAMLLDKRGMHDHAVNWLREASRGGHAAAQHVLGARLLVGRAAPFLPDEGVEWIKASAQQQVPEAMVLMSTLATLAGEWDEAVSLTKAAAGRGDERARQQIELLGDPQRFDATKWDAPVSINWKFESPRIGVIQNFIPAAFCDWIVDRARPKLQAAQLKGSQASGHRTNSGAGFSLLDSDLVLQMVNARVADAIDTPIINQEPTNVLHYKPGEEYKAHFDFITPSPMNSAELAATGQRTTTFLIYLNDDFEGGETDFPTLGWKFKGRKGDALVFKNLDDKGEGERKTLHAGLSPTKGEKWLYSKWVRANPYPLI